MKNYFLGCLLLFLSSCSTFPNKDGNGFVNEDENKFQIGSESTVELFNAFDNAWANKNYELLKTMISSDASFEFHDGRIATGAEEFIALIKEEAANEQALGITFSWTTEYAFSVDLNTEKEGEWVNAGFTAKADNPQDGVIEKVHNEWYYFENEKLEQWYQTTRKVMD
jgi:hypothetical protein